MLILGIDPGLSGAVCVLGAHDKSIHALFDVPTSTCRAEKRERVDPAHLKHCLKAFGDQVALIVIEKVGAMPGNGVTSMFRFGEACGTIRGVLGGLGVWERAKILEAFPAVWKASMGVSASKTSTLELARNIIEPKDAHLVAKAKHHNRAEALLLAHFGQRAYYSHATSNSQSGPKIDSLL